MSFVAAAIGGSALIGAYSANKGAKAQTNAANKQMKLDERIYRDQSEFFSPYRESGENALAAYNYEMGIGQRPQDYGGFQNTPGYDFQMQQGQQAIDGSAASRGQVFSGATLRAQQQFGQGLANQEYGNYMNRLSGMAGAGQAAAGQQATAAGNMGVSQGNALANIGNAQAAGAIGVGNAVTGAANNWVGYNAYQQANNAPRTGGFNVGRPGSLFGGNSWG